MIDIKDAMALENLEQVTMINNRTRRVINGTYGKRSATKKRHKLSGKRKWKNKEEQYAVLEGQMTVREYNARTEAVRALKNYEKQKAKQRKKHSLY